MESVRHHGRATAYREAAGSHADVTDTEPTVCYVHGSGGTHRVWAGQYGAGGPTGSAVAVDLSGHGESDDVDTDPGGETLDAYARDVVAVAREAGATVLAGNSLGGAVALWVALETEFDPDGLVLAGTGAKLPVTTDLREWLGDDFERAVAFLHGPDRLFHDADERVVERSTAQMRATGRAVTERDFLTCHRFDVRERLGEVETPALAVVGKYDGLTPPAYHEYLATELPDCEYAEVADAAHLAMAERPRAFGEAVSAFLDGLDCSDG
jgi:pimeloyl-ACP methyl ester carboxylesterase